MRRLTTNCLLLSFFYLWPLCVSSAQEKATQIGSDDAIRQALAASSLVHGGSPFHALLEISGPSPAYSGSIELRWAAPDIYQLEINSPGFHQLHIQQGAQQQETSTGDFFPRWLEDFSSALLHPEVLFTNFTGHDQKLTTGGEMTRSCLQRDDRPGNITDQMTWGIACFEGSQPLLESVFTFNHNVSFEDYKVFGTQHIARTWTTDVLDFKPVIAHITKLEPLGQTDPKLFTVNSPVEGKDVWKTGFVPTYQAAGMLDIEPKIEWPATPEGRTDGYMIVYARTDRTGQVRESAKHNSDNPRLEQFGMEQALRFKFKPLIIDGVAQQMELPMVLHFTSRIENPTPELTDEQTRAQISGCRVPRPKSGQTPFRVRVSVDEHGKLTGETYIDSNTPGLPHQSSDRDFSLRNCRFAPLVLNGKASYYHGLLLLP